VEVVGAGGFLDDFADGTRGPVPVVGGLPKDRRLVDGNASLVRFVRQLVSRGNRACP
jgi:hypothetical protein